eukprot:522277-Pyramimonas_sp.AAC.1
MLTLLIVKLCMLQPQETPTVTSLRDAYRWVEHNLAVIFRWKGQRAIDAIQKKLGRCTVSTTFSGTGGAENALDAIACGLNHFYSQGDSKPATPTNVWACEWFDESRNELK